MISLTSSEEGLLSRVISFSRSIDAKLGSSLGGEVFLSGLEKECQELGLSDCLIGVDILFVITSPIY